MCPTVNEHSLFLNNSQEVDKIMKNFSRFNIKNYEYLYVLFISKDVVEKDSYIITFGKIFRNNIQRSCYYNEKKSEKIVNIITIFFVLNLVNILIFKINLIIFIKIKVLIIILTS